LEGFSLAAKVPEAAGSSALAGDWQNTIPYMATTASLQVDAVKAGRLRGPDLVLPFTVSANDIDNLDTYTVGAAIGARVVAFAWMPLDVDTWACSCDKPSGVFTFLSSGNATGFLLVWLDAL
jgi:hypothetical protein